MDSDQILDDLRSVWDDLAGPVTTEDIARSRTQLATICAVDDSEEVGSFAVARIEASRKLLLDQPQDSAATRCAGCGRDTGTRFQLCTVGDSACGRLLAARATLRVLADLAVRPDRRIATVGALARAIDADLAAAEHYGLLVT